ncbi:hypothetical protein C8Q77DRAFT_1073878 [Trametes polyzona]|nr:hypothetical protein C8Q77DRAFT_1073878 [Trametes polyzona]
MSLHEVVMLLSHRTTSKPEDEVVAISGLISLDLGAIQSITGEDAADLQIKEFLLQTGTLPKSIVITIIPRLGFPGFRWAPWYQSGMGDRTYKGFLAALNLALFEDLAEIFLTERSMPKPTSPWQATIHFVHVPSKTTYLTEISGDTVDDDIASFLANGPLFMKEELPTAENSTSVQCAIVRAVEGSDFNLHPELWPPNAGIPGNCQLTLLYFQHRGWLG